MLSDCCSRINRLAASKEPSPYILQLRRFEERVSQKFPKLKNTSKLRRSQLPKKDQPEDYLEAVRKMLANSENIELFGGQEIDQVHTEENPSNRHMIQELK